MILNIDVVFLLQSYWPKLTIAFLQIFLFPSGWVFVLSLVGKTMGVPPGGNFVSCLGRPFHNGLRSCCRGFEGLQNSWSSEILAGLIPRQQNFYRMFLHKLEGKLSGLRDAESRSKETWFILRIEQYLRAGQVVGLTMPSSRFLLFSTGCGGMRARLKICEMASEIFG